MPKNVPCPVSRGLLLITPYLYKFRLRVIPGTGDKEPTNVRKTTCPFDGAEIISSVYNCYMQA